MKKFIALWIATVAILIYGVWHYADVATRFAGATDPQSLAIHDQASDLFATYLVVLVVAMFIGPLVLGIFAGYQSYREAHPRRSVPKSAAYWDKRAWWWLVGYFLVFVASCVTLSWNIPLGVVGIALSAYPLYKGLACHELSNELKHPSLVPGAYDPREHPI